METQNELVTKLKQEAAKDEAFNAVCHMFAARERARQNISLYRLNRVMHQEGFKYTKNQYARVLARLAALGLGKVEKGRDKRLRGLKEINVKLQSIGVAAASPADGVLQPYLPRTRFKKVPQTFLETPPVVQTKRVPVIAKAAHPSNGKILLAVTVGKQRVEFELPLRGLRLMSKGQ